MIAIGDDDEETEERSHTLLCTHLCNFGQDTRVVVKDLDDRTNSLLGLPWITVQRELFE